MSSLIKWLKKHSFVRKIFPIIVIVAGSFCYLSQAKNSQVLNYVYQKNGRTLSTSCDQTTETGEILFGSLLTAQAPLILFGAMTVIIIAVQIVERVFDFLLDLAMETPFEKVIFVIQQELMIVGFTALLFKVIFNTTHFLNHNWFFALEYSGK